MTHTIAPYVYIVEDDKGTNELMAFLLRQKGFHPVQNFDGNLDYGLFKKAPPSLFIIDIELPVVRGETLIGKLRENAETKETPIIIISANKHVEEVSQQYNVEQFLCKPFDVDDFKTLLNKLHPENPV
jgi:DNA-binding response OmpR family regulator